MPKVGQRSNEPGQHLPMEWDGSTWAPVCPTDDVAMRDRDAQGWLVCGVCRVRSIDAA